MEVYYSVTNKDLTIYDKNGICIVRIHAPFDMNEVARRWNIADKDIHIAL